MCDKPTCDNTCEPVKSIPFVKKQAVTSNLCGAQCNKTTLEIDCITSQKTITQNSTSTVACTNKIKLSPNITIYDGATDGPGPITVATNTFVTTTAGNDLELALSPSVATGCVIYIGHSSSSSGTLTISGSGDPLSSPPVTIQVVRGSFICFWKSDTWLSSSIPF